MDSSSRVLNNVPMLPNGQQNFPGPVAREVKSAIQEINPYQLDSAVS